MEKEDYRLAILRLAQDAKKEVGGAMFDLTTEEVLERASAYSKFIFGEV